MAGKGKIKLNYIEDFRIACKINNLKHEELLQYFIDHVSFYAFIGGDITPAYLWATAVVVDCKEEFGGEIVTVTNQLIKEISLRHIKKLTALSMETELSNSIKTRKSNALMKKWSAEMLPLTDYQTKLSVEGAGMLDLSFDFNLLCRMNGLDVQQQLQYFIDHISLARDRAINLFEAVKTNPSIAVLMLMVSSHVVVKNKILPYQDIYRKYGLQLLELDQQQKEENNLENRINNYSSFYLDWFKALNYNTN